MIIDKYKRRISKKLVKQLANVSITSNDNVSHCNIVIAYTSQFMQYFIH